uniref:Uncharacterized protein n=1 Tax=Arion vulgaris TaxID=1028688 RepID=A0A0B6YRZ3_9EUPU
MMLEGRGLRAYDSASTKESLMCVCILDGSCSFSLKIFSNTDISVDVVSCPHTAIQSLTTSPAAKTSLPLFTVPATSGTWRSDDSSSKSSTDVFGGTMPP